MWDTIPVQDPPRTAENDDLDWWRKRLAEQAKLARLRPTRLVATVRSSPAGVQISAPPGAAQ